MANAVEICNLALSFLGDRATVASINPPEQTAQAQMCATYYPIARSALLEMHDWSFATKRAILARLDDEDDSGWNGVYQLPSDTMHVIRVKPYGTENPLVRDGVQYPFFETNPTDCRFDVLGRKLYTNAENPVAHYVSSEVSEGAFTPTFVTALAYYLAGQIAGARVKGKEGQTVAQTLQKQFMVALSIAKSRDANQQNRRTSFVPKWLAVR